MSELSTHFTSDEKDENSSISVRLFRADTGNWTSDVAFLAPLGDLVLDDLKWYLEVFAMWPTGPDYQRAERIEAQMEDWGRALLTSVTPNRESAQIWRDFARDEADSKLITIDAIESRVLCLPWELLADEAGHLFAQGIGVRRRLKKVSSALLKPFSLPVRVLVVVSRPDDVTFIDPRVVSWPLLDALSELGDRAVTEFLYPPTLKALTARLHDPAAPPVHVVHFDGHGIYDTSLGLGYILFENDKHKTDRVDANRLGTLLSGCGVPLMVLNACQSAAQEKVNPYGSIAARLIRAGVGSVLAMNYSVLVTTAHKFVKAFYGGLAQGLTVGQAMDKGRYALLADEERHTLTRRNAEGKLVEETIHLRDWFLPALYQQSADPRVFDPEAPYLEGASARALPLALRDPNTPGGLPLNPAHGFHGRAREILRLERALAERAIVVLHGFGGVGKTALAAEAGRWFYRIGRFPGGVAFVSFERGGSLNQLCSWVGQAISGDPNFLIGEGHPVDRVVDMLRQRPALVILDNFESVLGRELLMPSEELQVVLDAAWKWSKEGRILVTTRDTTFNDTRFKASKDCAYIQLEGLQTADALALAAAVLDDHGIDRASVDRQELVDLMDRLGGHPLSLSLVLPHLQHLSPSEVTARFEELLPGFTVGLARERNESLEISLEFSLGRLGHGARTALTDLAIFQGGCLEPELLKITGMEPTVWQAVRTEMEAASLVIVERMPGVKVPFLRFHPTLLPSLARRLSSARRLELETRFWQRYHNLAKFLVNLHKERPHEAQIIALREWPNLRFGLDLAIAGSAADEAADFFDSLAVFLDLFGRWREKNLLLEKIKSVSSTMTKEGEYDLVRAQSESLQQQGKPMEAAKMLSKLSSAAKGKKKALLLADTARCFSNAGKHERAVSAYQEAIKVFKGTKDDYMLGVCYLELGDVLAFIERQRDAIVNYNLALKVFRRARSLLGVAAVAGNLGILAFHQKNFCEALKRLQESRKIYHNLGLSREEGVDLTYIAQIYGALGKWDEAEQYEREALKIWEDIGEKPRISESYVDLGVISGEAGRLPDAERWLIEGTKIAEQLENPLVLARALQSLAILYRSQNRLEEAAGYARRVVELHSLHDLSSQISKTYRLLAEIAEAQGRSSEAALWRQKEEESCGGNAGAPYQS